MPVRSWIRVAALPFLLAGVARAQVTIAQRPNAGPFATIQAGIDAALEGEALLVTPGSYSSFTIDGKSVQVFVTGGMATVAGRVIVKNLTPGQYVVLSRLDVQTGFPNVGLAPALLVSNSGGHVRVHNSVFKGSGTYGTSPYFISNPAVLVDVSVNVVFSECTLTGGSYPSFPSLQPADGGRGLDSKNSSVALYACTLRGGEGTSMSDPRGGHGGRGYSGLNYGLFATGCSFRGGNGGDGDWPPWCVGGTGGDALAIDSGQAHLLGNSYTIGIGGFGVDGGGPQAPNGGTTVALNGSYINSMAGTERRITATSITSDHVSLPITITGQPGDTVYLMLARKPGFLWKPAQYGAVLVQVPMLSNALAGGTIGASGTLVLNRTFDIPDGTVAARLFWLQALCVDTSGVARLTGPAQVLSLE